MNPASGPMGRSWSSSYQLKRLVPDGVPGVAEHEERRAVGLFQRVVVGGGAEKAAAQRILLFLRLRSRRSAVKEPVLPARPGSAGSDPLRHVHVPGCGREQADTEGLPAVPEAVNPLVEVRAGEVDPDGHVGVGVREGARGRERQLLLLPDMHWGSAWRLPSNHSQGQSQAG